MKYTVALSIVLAAVWLAWSGHYTTFLLTLGTLSVLLVVGLLRRASLVDRETSPIEFTVRIALYLPWLALEIVKANVDVLRRVLDPRLPIAPEVFHVRTGQRTDFMQALYANSITLTPGTISAETIPGRITVHALTPAAADGVRSGDMDRRVCRVEGRP